MHSYEPHLGYTWKEILDALYARQFKERSTGVFVGICIFHKERTPSLHLYPGTNHFFCYGCGAVGSMSDFIVQYNKMMIHTQRTAAYLLEGKRFFPSTRQMWLDLPPSCGGSEE